MFCQPVRDAWLRAAVLGRGIGAIRPGALDVPTIWAPPAWPRIHPTQDVDAARIEVEAGFRSRASVIGELGFDAEDVDRERSADQSREKALGLSKPV